MKSFSSDPEFDRRRSAALRTAPATDQQNPDKTV